MTVVIVEHGRVIVPMAGAVSLPDVITTEFLDAVFEAPLGDPGHIAELHQYLSPADKRKFMLACDLFGDKYFTPYAVAATSWASVAEPDGVWVLRNILYTWEINSWLISRLHADTHGFFFATTIQQGREVIMSAKEFDVHFGDTIESHLRKWLDFFPVRVNQAIAAITEKWVGYEVTIQRGNGLVCEKRMGPPHIEPREWNMASGDTFVSADRTPCPT